MPAAIIIGAGPAGATAAITLARAGWQVTIIESRPFPRSKPCGEFISPAATTLLESLISPTELRHAGARQIHTFVLHLDDRQKTWNMPHPAWALSRAALDALLLSKAIAAGAHCLQPATVTHARYTGNTAHVQLTTTQTLHADIIIHADGSGRHDPAGPIPCSRNLLAIKCHFHPPEPLDALHMRAAPDAYIGTIPVEHTLTTCAAVIHRRHITHSRGNIDAALTSLWPQWNPRHRSTDWLACPVPLSGYITPGHPRSFRIGNAAAAVDPVGGEGIALALWSGHTLATLLAPFAAAGPTPADLAHIQHTLATAYRRRLRIRRPACRILAQALMRPRLAAALWPLLAIPSLTIRPWYHLTGKPTTPAAAGSLSD